MPCLRLTDDQREEAERHLDLCETAARKFARRYPHVGRGAFLSAAFEGLADAVAGHDPARGVPLAIYARPRIEGECFELLRADRGGPIRLSRRAPASFRVTSCHDAAPLPGRDPDPAAAVAADDGFEGLLGGLDAVARFVIRRVYAGGWNFREVADHLGLSPSRVGQIHAAALPVMASRSVRCGPGVGRRRGRPPGVSAPGRPGGRWSHPGGVPVARAVDPAAVRATLAAGAGADPADLAGLLARIRPNHRRAVELREGLDGTARPWAEVARLLGLTRYGAEYAHRAGLARLRAMSGEAAGVRGEAGEGDGGRGPESPASPLSSQSSPLPRRADP